MYDLYLAVKIQLTAVYKVLRSCIIVHECSGKCRAMPPTVSMCTVTCSALQKTFMKAGTYPICNRRYTKGLRKWPRSNAPQATCMLQAYVTLFCKLCALHLISTIAAYIALIET